MVPIAPSSSLSLADLEGHDSGAKVGGMERRFLCPLPGCTDHQNPRLHRCLTVNAQTGAWNCKRCHEKGLLKEWHTQRPDDAQLRPFVSRRDRDRSRLRSLLEIKPRPAVADITAGQKPAPLPGPLLAGVQSLADTSGVDYLAGRGLPLDFCHAAGVRFGPDYFGRPAVLFPLRDAAGHLAAMHGRYVDGRTDPKSRTKGSMAQAAFATPGAWNGDPWQGRVVVTEAPLDALTLAYCGVPAIAICGTSGGRELLKFRLKLGQAVAAFDADIAGHEAGRALAALLAPVGCVVLRLLPPEGAKDWNAALQTIGPDALRDYLTGELSEGHQVGPVGTDAPESQTAQNSPVFLADAASMNEHCSKDADALLAFVKAAHWGTGLDIRAMDGRVVLVEKGKVVGVWAGPASGRLALPADYWRAVGAFPIK